MGISSALGSSALLPAGLGFRNVIINGDFRINQRAFTSTTTSGQYGFDRWYVVMSGGTVTYSAQTFALGNAISGQEPVNFARVVTSGQSASGNFAVFAQKIEGVRTFAGQQVFISFWAKAGSGTPKVAVEWQQEFGTGGSPSAEVNTYVGQVTLSTSWTRYSLQISAPSVSGKTVGTANNDSVRLGFFLSAGSDLNSRTGSLGLQSATFEFWGVQVEQNYQPTPFEQRPIGIELALCQRYYYMHADGSEKSQAVLGTGTYISATGIEGGVQFPVTMRSTPTLSATSGTDIYRFYRVAGADDFNSIAIGSGVTSSKMGWYGSSAGVTGGTAGDSGIVHINSSSTTKVAWEAEL